MVHYISCRKKCYSVLSDNITWLIIWEKINIFDSHVASAARTSWTPLSFSLIGWLMFLVPVPYRKSLSWNTLRARKRAEAKDISVVGVRGQENGLLRKPKESTPPPPLTSPAPGAKGKVSKAGRRRTLVMCVPKPLTCLPSPPLVFFFFFLTRVCTHVCVHTHKYTLVVSVCHQWFSICTRQEVRHLGTLHFVFMNPRLSMKHGNWPTNT